MKLQVKNGVRRPQPDPFMCPYGDGWVMYATGMTGVDAYSAETPLGPWEYRGAVLQTEGFGEYWAPCMYEEGGRCYLYFSCRPIDSDVAREELYVASAPGPFGPFEAPRRLFECFSIDPHVVRTEAGLFLWYCMDRTDTDRVGTRVFVQQLADPMTPVGEPVEAIVPSFDEEIFMKDRYVPGQHWHTIEGPFYLAVGQWQYVMYSGACYQNDTYHIGYCAAHTSEPDLRKVRFEKHAPGGVFSPLMTKNEQEEGVGHHSVICWQGRYYAIYHARDLTHDPLLGPDQRTARICRLDFQDGVITAERIEDL